MKKEALSFLHDSNASRDEKMLMLRARGGFAYYGLYWMVIEALREANDYHLQVKFLEGLSISLNCPFDEFKKFFDTCVELGLFIVTDDLFSSESLLSRMGAYDEVRNKRSRAGKVSAEKRNVSKNEQVPTREHEMLNTCSTHAQHMFNLHENININTNKINLDNKILENDNARARESDSQLKPPEEPPAIPPEEYLTKLETRVFVETWRMPELERWFKNSGFENPQKAIKYAALVVNGSYEKRNINGTNAPAKCYSDLISWGNLEAQKLRKAKIDTQAAEARREKAVGPAPPQRPKSQSVNEILKKQLAEIEHG